MGKPERLLEGRTRLGEPPKTQEREALHHVAIRGFGPDRGRPLGRVEGGREVSLAIVDGGAVDPGGEMLGLNVRNPGEQDQGFPVLLMRHVDHTGVE